MKHNLFLIIIFFSLSASAQKVFIVNDFSDKYYGKIQIDDTAEVFSPGWVAIYEYNTDREIIRVVSQELAISLHEGEALVNILSLPYGEQSLIFHDDFNFDGKKDFAISDGQNSCYHGPSFKIYLAGAKGFTFSEDFTRLAQDYCGMFDTDLSSKMLSAFSKSGCCWHQLTQFIVVNNKPKAVYKMTEEHAFPFHTMTEEKWNGKTMVSKTTKKLNPLDIDVILSFHIPKNGKQVYLFNLNDRMLYYALLTKDSIVEFSFPVEAVYQRPDFKFDSSANNLSVVFANKDATYRVYEHAGDMGIMIITRGKKYNWIGDKLSKEGSLSRLRSIQLDNVVR